VAGAEVLVASDGVAVGDIGVPVGRAGVLVACVGLLVGGLDVALDGTGMVVGVVVSGGRGVEVSGAGGGFVPIPVNEML
jgi:hypothetical protein